MSVNRTFIAGVTIYDAAFANGLQAAWDAYGNSASFTGSTTNPTGHTWVGHSRQVGKDWKFWVQVTVGTGFGSGTYQIALPTAPIAGSPCHADVQIKDVSSGAIYRGIGYQWSGTTLSLAVGNGTAGGAYQPVTNAVPMTFALGDLIEVWGSFEGA